MAEVQLDGPLDLTAGDIEMDPIDVDAGELENGAEEDDGDVMEEEATAPRVLFIDYLKSPIVEIVVGSGEDQTFLTVHQGLLMRSPYLADRCSRFSEDATFAWLTIACAHKERRIELGEYDIDPVGCLLQYLYTGEYFPRKLNEGRLEDDPSAPAVDDSGEQLLKHARVYTLADKLGLDELKALAHSKIHRINSNAKGEIAYARFVYANTPREDTTIRKPVAAFWAHRSHVLRHEAEDEFRKMCLEFPQFGFDVLSLVLDAKEKSREKEHPGERSSRKRIRQSQG
ncbi:hypothetical protein GP486_002310 [Trichoglossum hirsutum]|uniref:BTB domain-containing protein n=1 Tax=Trichoglossum hirsutum TaxID=265104 RepID=A0A9P8LF05_9PEZI|nr:hypothetical protein GP486_002310 [Trichoglossum hirsutum]